jgi:hypothetical protein
MAYAQVLIPLPHRIFPAPSTQQRRPLAPLPRMVRLPHFHPRGQYRVRASLLPQAQHVGARPAAGLADVVALLAGGQARA